MTQGLIGVVLVTIIIAIGLTITGRRANSGFALGFAVIVSMIICNLDEDLFDGKYLTFQYLTIIMAVLISSNREGLCTDRLRSDAI